MQVITENDEFGVTSIVCFHLELIKWNPGKPLQPWLMKMPQELFKSLSSFALSRNLLFYYLKSR